MTTSVDEFKAMDARLDPATITEYCRMIGGENNLLSERCRGGSISSSVNSRTNDLLDCSESGGNQNGVLWETFVYQLSSCVF